MKLTAWKLLPILTPIGAHLPAFKENQYMVHLYFYLKRNIFVVFSRKETKIVFCFRSYKTAFLRSETLEVGIQSYILIHEFDPNTVPTKNERTLNLIAISSVKLEL